MAILDRVVLGTVQFGLPYGRSRHLGLINEEDVWRILDRAWELGIRAFDTAEAYGAAPERLARWIASRGVASDTTITTKLQLFGRVPAGSAVSAAVERFRGCRQVTLLTHDLCREDAWHSLLEMLAPLDVLAGQSLYDEVELEMACRMPAVARIQCPASLVYFGRVAGIHSVPLDLRSPYVQGLLLESPDDAERRVPGSRALVETSRRLARESGWQLASLLVRAVLVDRPAMDRVVLGVEDLTQLEIIHQLHDIPDASAAHFSSRLRETAGCVADLRLLDPRSWPT